MLRTGPLNLKWPPRPEMVRVFSQSDASWEKTKIKKALTSLCDCSCPAEGKANTVRSILKREHRHNLFFLPGCPMSGNVLRAPLNGPAKHTGSILGLWWQLLFIFVTILFRQKAQHYTTERSRQMGLFTYLSLWNSSNASSHAAGERHLLLSSLFE